MTRRNMKNFRHDRDRILTLLYSSGHTFEYGSRARFHTVNYQMAWYRHQQIPGPS